MRAPEIKRQEAGFALFMGLIFLLMITLVAVTAMRGTSLELAMANNTALYEESFQAAEASRTSLVRSILPMLSCKRWPAGARLTSGGGSACAVADCSRGGGPLGNQANYTWEQRLTIDDTSIFLNTPIASQQLNDPRTYVARFSFKYGANMDSLSQVGAAQLPISIPPGSGAAQQLGYEGLGGGGARYNGDMYFDIVARSTNQSARANVAGHFRAATRDIHPDNCDTDLSFGT